MNAAAKVINQGTLFNGHWTEMRMSKSIYFLVGLLIVILISALMVVYSTNAYRSTLSAVEQEELQSHFLQLQWGQLLLEQASLATPSRVEELAVGSLKMKLPGNKVYLLHASQQVQPK